MAARAGSWTVPEWQDDDDVAQCPICGRRFGLLCRRHHCRRCGKVICAVCSPHRITIPHQYIVRPPGESYHQFRQQLDDPEEEPDSNPALGGGETVRVCNPCVPDPNYGPPPLHGGELYGSRAQFNDGTQYTFPPYNSSPDAFRAATFHSPRRSPDRNHPDRYRTTTTDPTSPTRRAQAARTYYSRRANSDAIPAHQVLEARFRRREHQPDHPPEDRGTREDGFRQYNDFDFSRQPQSGNTWQPFAHHGRSSSNMGAAQPQDASNQSGAAQSRPIHGSRVPGPPPPPHFRHGTSAPAQSQTSFASLPLPPPRMRIVTGRRQPSPALPAEPVGEEDECPVCGTTAPPFGRRGQGEDDGGRQKARERHIEACITSHLSFNSPSRETAAPPLPAGSMQNTAGVAGATSDGASEPGPASWVAARLPSLVGGGGSSSGSGAAHSSPAPPSPSPRSPPSSQNNNATSTAPGDRRPRAPTNPLHQHQQRMLVYHATEKDCRDDSGAASECVICLEEFDVGDEMGRLECLCKFHRRCIRAWWESGGGGNTGGAAGVNVGGRWGSCPTHTLHS